MRKYRPGLNCFDYSPKKGNQFSLRAYDQEKQICLMCQISPDCDTLNPGCPFGAEERAKQKQYQKKLYGVMDPIAKFGFLSYVQEKYGVSKSTIYNTLKGTRQMSIEKAAVVSKAANEFGLKTTVKMWMKPDKTELRTALKG